MKRIRLISVPAIVSLVLGVLVFLQYFSAKLDARVLTALEMEDSIGTACCRHWRGGEDCQKCVVLSTYSKRYNHGGLAETCVEGTPDGCTMTGTYVCHYGTVWLIFKNRDCTDYIGTSSVVGHSIPDAVGSACDNY